MTAIRRAVAAGALALGLLVGWVAPASAHALLLRTDPSPQTSVKRSPTAVRLLFSERVEVTFGAIRIFDVDGHPVAAGPRLRHCPPGH